MGDYTDLFESTAKADRKSRPTHPKGWEPGATLGETDGFLVTQPKPLEGVATPENEPWADHLRRAGIDPDTVRVIPPVEVRTWDMNLGDGVIKAAVYFKAKLERRRGAAVDVDLLPWIRKWKPLKRARHQTDKTVVVPWSDWQIGKTSSKEGTPETHKRILDGFDKTVDYITHHKPKRIVVPVLGDLIENCAGFYPQQTYTVDLSLTEQEYLVQNLLTQGIKLFSDLAGEVIVLPVGGNHGENRTDGASFTDFADNFDVAVFRHVRDILAENPDRFGNVHFAIPKADLTQTVEVDGWVIGLLHGHQATRGATISAKIDNWWQGQMKARDPIGDADVLLNGHYHHFIARSVGPRWHFQMPSMDMGSEWWDQTHGGREPSGQVAFTVSEDGWDNLRIF